jgi:hypothetical protein
MAVKKIALLATPSSKMIFLTLGEDNPNVLNALLGFI